MKKFKRSVEVSARPQRFDISIQIAKATEYMDRTRNEFAKNAHNAKRLMVQMESGALAGPALHHKAS